MALYFQEVARSEIPFQNVSMIYGYARVSTTDQNLNLQLDALRAAGCIEVFQDRGVSGTKAARQGLSRALAALKQGDTLTVWRLDRLGRSLSDLLAILKALEGRGVAFRSLQEGMDTSTSTGRLVYQIAGAFAEYELQLKRERALAGIASAKARGRHLGRRPLLSTEQQSHAKVLTENGASLADIARLLKVGKTTVHRAIQNGTSKPVG